MQQIVDYDVVKADDLETLVKKVRESLEKGWVPHGGICEGGDNDNYKFFQAIVRLM